MAIEIRRLNKIINTNIMTKKKDSSVSTVFANSMKHFKNDKNVIEAVPCVIEYGFHVLKNCENVQTTNNGS